MVIFTEVMGLSVTNYLLSHAPGLGKAVRLLRFPFSEFSSSSYNSELSNSSLKLSHQLYVQ